MRAFAQAERFVSEVESRKLRPAYVFVEDEAFFRKRFRDAILQHLVPAELRDFSIFEFDLAENDLAEVLDRARTPSLIALVADHISIPADVRRMEMQDKERYQRIRETMGQYCGIVELARVEEGEAVRWISDYCTGRAVPVKIDPDGARELVDALGGDMMMISNELEKLMLYVGARNRITLGDVETMVLAAKQLSDTSTCWPRLSARCW